MAGKLTRGDLLSLEQYAEQRPLFRARIIEHKRNRRLPIGPCAVLYFEDRLSMQYQIQEMLRAERIFESAAIQDELDAYNPLIPDGTNLKATFMIEIEDAVERRAALAQLIDIEHRVWIRVAGFDAVHAIADEDMERADSEKTSSVHFLRFEFTPAMIAAIHNGAPLAAGIDHPGYQHWVDPIPRHIRDSLENDFS